MSVAAAPTGRCINLTFHGIGQPPRELAPGEQDVWISGEEFVAILDGVDGRGDVRLSFDDGNVSDVCHALPELRLRAMHATFFVVASRLGQPGFLSEDDLRTLSGAGMTIGCHGMAHRSWRKLDARESREEMLVARTIIEQVVGREVTEAACPFGSYDRRVLRSLWDYGYRRVFTSDGGPAEPARWLQARNSIHNHAVEQALEQISASDAPRRRALLRHARLAVKRWR